MEIRGRRDENYWKRKTRVSGYMSQILNKGVDGSSESLDRVVAIVGKTE